MVEDNPRCDAWFNSDGLLVRCTKDLGHPITLLEGHIFTYTLGTLIGIVWGEDKTLAHFDGDVITLAKRLTIR